MNIAKYTKYSFYIFIIIFSIILLQIYGLNNIKSNLIDNSLFTVIALFLLRSSSIIIPALPGTAYSILAGTLFGFQTGYIVICLADLIACSISFNLSRKYGQKILNKITSKRISVRISKLSKVHIENNFFLRTGLLMTGFFDFMCYAIGLTRVNNIKFYFSLIISILLSNIPVVALGSGFMNGGKSILLLSILGMFLLAFLNGKLKNILKSR